MSFIVDLSRLLTFRITWSDIPRTHLLWFNSYDEIQGLLDPNRYIPTKHVDLFNQNM